MDDTISRQAAIDALNGMKIYRPLDSDRWVISDCLNKIVNLPSAERLGRWTIDAVHQYELAYGATAYEPVYKCSCCGCLTESYLRLDEPIMPNDADFPKWCGNCGARMMNEDD